MNVSSRMLPVLATFFLVLLALPASADVLTTGRDKKITKPLEVKRVQAKLCTNLKTTIQTEKTATGIVKLTGKVRNLGPGSILADPPLVGFFALNWWHPPHTLVQDGYYEELDEQVLGSLAAGASKTLETDFQVPNFSRWGHFPNSATEKQAMRVFTACIRKQGNQAISRCEDIDYEDLCHTSIEFAYMEKIE
jgi:hypothetical protein